MLKRFAFVLTGFFLVLVMVIIVRTRSKAPLPMIAATITPVPLDAEAALDRFAGAIRIKTVSQPLLPPDADAMRAFRDYLDRSFPRVHAVMQREIVHTGALLFTWTGQDPSLAPILMLGHMDVVPVDPSTLPRWMHDPFSADRANGFLWGRGTQDDKQAVCALLEAGESLLAQKYQPRRTIYFAFGDDEENDGHGAEAIAGLLASRNVHPGFVLDEGGQIARGTIPGVRGDVALISIAEKGIASLQLTVRSAGGHSSRPPEHTAIGILSRAVTRLEENQLPASVSGVTGQMLEALAPRMSFGQRAMVRNRAVFGPWLLRSLARTPNGNALIRTTTAVTMFNGGVKDNVLPSQATVVVNFRILPGDTVDSVTQHVRAVIADSRVSISLYGDLAADPSPISTTATPAFAALTQTVQEFFPEALVAPNLLVARTDSARYTGISSNIYKFFPAIRDEADGDRVHGTNERLGTNDYLRSVQFMAALLRREADQ